ncbi:MAG: ABC transporter ATP-binding protein [Fodinibius sp.]|nr:ABC transporter ATP-binding protein [Fodinibius sp.]
MNAPEIAFENISFGFEDESILDGFSFRAPAGRHTVLKGESGSGKSTMLQLILGFYEPQSGQILVDDNPRQPRVVRKQSAWLPQDLDLGDNSVRNVMLRPFDFAANASQKPSEAKLTQCLQQLGLGADNLDKAFRDLSTGQRQRVGLAVCGLLNKPLLLLDEPTSALDAASRQKVAEMLLNGQRTIISTSHDPFWVERADHIIALN